MKKDCSGKLQMEGEMSNEFCVTYKTTMGLLLR